MRKFIGLAAGVLVACSGGEAVVKNGLVEGVDERGTTSDGLNTAVAIGSTLEATANLKLRTAPSLDASVRLIMPSGARVKTINRTTPEGNWYNISFNGISGWSHGGYLTLVVENSNPASGGRADAIARAKSGVGFSYWWGHGRWLPNASVSSAGSCTGDCPSCSHSGGYGADCSGFVAKVWQVPAWNSEPENDAHPYSTWTFVGSNSAWSTVSRAQLKPADALVYNDGSSGHIALYEAGDGWGSLWTYEARGCAYGIVHNLRSFGSEYKGIKRAGY